MPWIKLHIGTTWGALKTRPDAFCLEQGGELGTRIAISFLGCLCCAAELDN
jgi:hypothetical protein